MEHISNFSDAELSKIHQIHKDAKMAVISQQYCQAGRMTAHCANFAAISVPFGRCERAFNRS
jgi:hypothetical protein